MVLLPHVETLTQPARDDAVAEMAVDAPPPAPAHSDADPIVGAGLIILLCLVAGVGTVLLLPGRFSVAWRRLGGGIALVAGLGFLLALGVRAEDRPVVYFWIFAAIALVGSVRVITHPRPVYSALYFVLTVFASAGLFVLLWAEFMAVALVIIYAGAILITYTFVIMLAADAAPTGVGQAGDASREEAVRDFLAEHDRRARAPASAAAVGFLTMAVLLFVTLDRAPQTLAARQSLTDARFLPTATQRTPDSLGSDPQGRSLAEADHVSADLPAAGPAASELGPRGDLYPANEQPSYANERGGIQVLGIYIFTRHLVSLQLAGLILTVAMIGAIVIARKQIIPDLRPAGLAEEEQQGEEMTMPFTPVSDDPKSLPVTGTTDPTHKAYPQN